MEGWCAGGLGAARDGARARHGRGTGRGTCRCAAWPPTRSACTATRPSNHPTCRPWPNWACMCRSIPTPAASSAGSRPGSAPACSWNSATLPGTAKASSVGPSGVPTDGYYSSVSLLLHADGSGSTFVDSSPTPKTITATNATQSATQSKWGGRSIYFDGSGDYLTVPSSAAFGFGTGDFTLEYWWYPTRNQGNETIIDTRSGDTANPLVLGKSAAGAVRCYDGSSVRTGGTMTLNDWNHVAWSRSGSDNSIYLNGTRVINFTNAFDAGSNRGLTIGANASVGFENAQGYIDDLRITKGSARGYTGATIQVPTAAFPDS